MTNEQILELAKTCGFDTFVGEKDDGTNCDYWECWEEQLLKFALAIHEDGYNKGYDDGCSQTTGRNLMTNFKTMTIEEAIDYCYEHKNDYIKDCDDVSEGMEQFECLISCLESGHINPTELPDYGMKY